VYPEQEMVKMLFSSYNSMRAVFEDMKRIKETERSLDQRLESYLDSKGWQEESTVLQLKQKCFLLDWRATNRILGRPIKTKQMLIYGRPSSQKTLMFEMLGEVWGAQHTENTPSYLKCWERC